MTDNAPPTKEERILRVMKRVLTQVIRETATSPGVKHPLSDETLGDMRECLVLISGRESELHQQSGHSPKQRPRYPDQRQADTKVAVDFKQPED